MSALSSILRKQAGGRVAWWCPGCDEAHGVTVEGPNAWTWDGNVSAPTFSPSVLVTGRDLTPEGRAMLDRGEDPPDGSYPGIDVRCHSCVQAGRMEFLADCTHDLAGQTVPIPTWPGYYDDGTP